MNRLGELIPPRVVSPNAVGGSVRPELLPPRLRSPDRRTVLARLTDPVTLGLAAVSLGLGAVLLLRPTAPPPLRPIRFLFTGDDSATVSDNYPWPAAISPDGGTVVYTVVTANGTKVLPSTHGCATSEQTPIDWNASASQLGRGSAARHASSARSIESTSADLSASTDGLSVELN